MNIAITASDGKVFKGTNYELLAKEVNAYESNLQLQKQKEEAERKAREEKAKAREQEKQTLKKEIDELAALLTTIVQEYEKVTNEVMQYVNENGELKVKRHEKYAYKASYSGIPLFWLQ